MFIIHRRKVSDFMIPQRGSLMRCEIAKKIISSEHYERFILPVKQSLFQVPALDSRGNRPLKMTFEDQLNALIFFHLQEDDSARHLIQELNEDDFAGMFVTPEGGISRSSFSEAVNHRGLEQLQHVFRQLSIQAESVLPKEYNEFGDLMLPDGSLINAVLSMHRADYRKGSEKAEAHFCSDLNYGIPSEISLTATEQNVRLRKNSFPPDRPELRTEAISVISSPTVCKGNVKALCAG
jgi:hypothetical protein